MQDELFRALLRVSAPVRVLTSCPASDALRAALLSPLGPGARSHDVNPRSVGESGATVISAASVADVVEVEVTMPIHLGPLPGGGALMFAQFTAVSRVPRTSTLVLALRMGRDTDGIESVLPIQAMFEPDGARARADLGYILDLGNEAFDFCEISPERFYFAVIERPIAIKTGDGPPLRPDPDDSETIARVLAGVPRPGEEPRVVRVDRWAQQLIHPSTRSDLLPGMDHTLFSWNRVHICAMYLQLKTTGVPRESLADACREALRPLFSGFRFGLDDLRRDKGGSLSFDDTWLLIEIIETLGTVLASRDLGPQDSERGGTDIDSDGRDQLWKGFAEQVVQFVESCRDETLEFALGWLVNEFTERPPTAPLGRHLASSIEQSRLRPAQVSLHYLVAALKSRNVEGRFDPDAPARGLDAIVPAPGLSTILDTGHSEKLIEVVPRFHAAVERFVSTNGRERAAYDFELGSLAKALERANGWSGVSLLARNRVILGSVCRRLDSWSKEGRFEPSVIRAAAGLFCETLLRSPAAFLATEIAEEARELRTHECMEAMIHALRRNQKPEQCVPLWVCFAEGIEELLAKKQIELKVTSPRLLDELPRIGIKPCSHLDPAVSRNVKRQVAGLRIFLDLINEDRGDAANQVRYWVTWRLRVHRGLFANRAEDSPR